MSSTLSFIFILISLISFYCCFSSIQTSYSKPTGFWAPVINRNSIHSPFHNRSLTRLDRIKASVRRSFARYNYLKFLTSNKASTNSFSIPAREAQGEYVMEYYIGTPAFRTYSILDTGSSTTWLQCLPCEKCHNQAEVPIFDPAKSSSYKQMTCFDDKCWLVRKHRCGIGRICEFTVKYGDNSLISGSAAEETLQFRSSDKNANVTVESFVIGCSHYYSGQETELTPGLIGLSRDPDSLISQLSYKRFAYCFGDFDDINTYGYMKFGDVAAIRGYTTPIQTLDSYRHLYYLNLEDISVDNTRLYIPNGTFSVQKRYSSGFIVDSGTTFTYLNKTGFYIMVAVIEENMVNMTIVTDPNGMFQLCYEIYWLDIQFASVITLHFSGLDLKLPLWNTWYNVEGDIYCLAMFPATDGLSMLGNYQQQNYNVGHDLENNVVSFYFNYCN